MKLVHNFLYLSNIIGSFWWWWTSSSGSGTCRNSTFWGCKIWTHLLNTFMQWFYTDMTFGRFSLSTLNALVLTPLDVGCFIFFTILVIWVHIKHWTNKQFIVSKFILFASNLSHHCHFNSTYSIYVQILFLSSQLYFLNILYVQLQILYMVQNRNIFFQENVFGGLCTFPVWVVDN